MTVLHTPTPRSGGAAGKRAAVVIHVHMNE